MSSEDLGGLQAEKQRCRAIDAAPGAPVNPAPYGAGPSSPPQITMSPRTPTALRTSGFAFFYAADEETVITIWKRDPASGLWAVFAQQTGIAPFVWTTVCNINASELWFEFGEGPLSCRIFLEEIGVSP